MILEYNKKFENENKYICSKFIGYITPEGETLSYNHPFGLGGHDRNYTTDIFMYYFYHDTSPNYDRFINDDYLLGEEYKKAFREYCLDKLPKKCLSTLDGLKHGYYVDKRDLLELRIRNLLLNCYQNEDFFKAYGRSLFIMSDYDFEKIYKESHDLSSQNDYLKGDVIECAYEDYWSSMILSYFKDTLVQYLGYDSVETELSRTICTSYPNINERFYNYKLMDFNIQQVSRMMWDEENKIYRPAPIEYQTEKEEILEKEIESIKRLVKREDRYQYFRTNKK